MCAQRKAGRRHPSHGPLRVITSRSPLPCEKRSAWGGGWVSTIWIEWKENKVATRRGNNVRSDSAQTMHVRLLVIRRIPIHEYYESVWGSCNAEFSDEIFKVEKTMCAYYTAWIGAPFQARTLLLFLELGWPPINQICIERRLLLSFSCMDEHRITSLRNCYLWNITSHNARSRLPFRLHIPRTNSMERMWHTVISDN